MSTSPGAISGRGAEKKTLGLLAEIRWLWKECLEAFAQYRTGCRAQGLGLSGLACLGRHTLTDLVCAGGRQFVDWSADYRLFSGDVCDRHEVFVPITQGVVDLLPAGAPVVTAMEDRQVRKTGTHTPGGAYRREPLSPAFHTNFIGGQRFLQMLRGRRPLPKWQSKRPAERLSTQELVRQLRSEVWAHAIDTLQLSSHDFPVDASGSVTKSSALRLPAVSAMLYSATG